MSKKLTYLHPDLPRRVNVCKINNFSWDWGMYLSSSSTRDDRSDYVG